MNEHEIGSIDAIPPGEGREFVVDGERIAVFRLRGDRVFATEARCPHMGAPLCDGLTGDATVTCPFHGWKFALDTGLAILGGCSLLTFPVRVDADRNLRLSSTPARPEAPAECATT